MKANFEVSIVLIIFLGIFLLLSLISTTNFVVSNIILKKESEISSCCFTISVMFTIQLLFACLVCECFRFFI